MGDRGRARTPRLDRGRGCDFARRDAAYECWHGILHSEFNHSDSRPVRLLQIWIRPERRSRSGYEQKRFETEELTDRLCLVASPDGGGKAVTIRHDVRVYAARLGAGAEASHRLADGRHSWLQVARGELSLNGIPMIEGDGASVSGETNLRIAAERRRNCCCSTWPDQRNCAETFRPGRSTTSEPSATASPSSAL